MAKRIAIIRNGIVENVIRVPDVWPSIPPSPNDWALPAGATAVVLQNGQAVGPGDSWNGTTFTAATPDPLVVNRTAVEADLRNDLANMQTIIDGPATMTTAQLTTATKAQARAIRRLIRIGLQLFDGSN